MSIKEQELFHIQYKCSYLYFTSALFISPASVIRTSSKSATSHMHTAAHICTQIKRFILMVWETVPQAQTSLPFCACPDIDACTPIYVETPQNMQYLGQILEHKNLYTIKILLHLSALFPGVRQSFSIHMFY